MSGVQETGGWSLLGFLKPRSAVPTAPAAPPPKDRVSLTPAPPPPPPEPKKPVIGILVESAPEPGKPVRRGGNYAKAVENSGGIAQFIYDDGRPVGELLDGLQGIVIPGGRDLHPHLYGQEPAPGVALQLGPLEFDVFEIKVVQAALERDMPIRGICRGHQLLNVAAGGTLYQDIAICMKPFPSVHHRNGVHGVVALKESRLGQLTGESGQVNSLHHQAVEKVAPGFIPVAIAKDGTIEAMEKADNPRIIGVQFHPEKPDSRLRRPFFDQLIDDATQYMAGQPAPASALNLTADAAMEQLRAEKDRLQKQMAAAASGPIFTFKAPVAPADEDSGKRRDALLVTLQGCPAKNQRKIGTALEQQAKFGQTQTELIMALLPELEGSWDYLVADAIVETIKRPDIEPPHAELLKTIGKRLASHGSTNLTEAYSKLLKKTPTPEQSRVLTALVPHLHEFSVGNLFNRVLDKTTLDDAHAELIERFVPGLRRDSYGTCNAIGAVMDARAILPAHIELLKTLEASAGSNYNSDLVQLTLGAGALTDAQCQVLGAIFREVDSSSGYYCKNAAEAVVRRPLLAPPQVRLMEACTPYLKVSSANSTAADIIKNAAERSTLDDATVTDAIAALSGITTDAWKTRGEVEKILRR